MQSPQASPLSSAEPSNLRAVASTCISTAVDHMAALKVCVSIPSLAAGADASQHETVKLTGPGPDSMFLHALSTNEVVLPVSACFDVFIIMLFLLTYIHILHCSHDSQSTIVGDDASVQVTDHQLLVHPPSGPCMSITLPHHSTVADVMTAVHDAHGVPVAAQVVTFGGKPLIADTLLLSLSLKPDRIIRVSARLVGGGNCTSTGTGRSVHPIPARDATVTVAVQAADSAAPAVAAAPVATSFAADSTAAGHAGSTGAPNSGDVVQAESTSNPLTNASDGIVVVLRMPVAAPNGADGVVFKGLLSDSVRQLLTDSVPLDTYVLVVWLSVLCMRSKSWLVARVSLRLARLPRTASSAQRSRRLRSTRVAVPQRQSLSRTLRSQ